LGEINGKDYHFVDDQKFEDLKNAGKLMENVEFNGYKYGLSATEVAEAIAEKKNSVVIVEPIGLKQITTYAESHGIELVRIYIGGTIRVLLDRYLQRSSQEDLSDATVSARHARRIESMFYNEVNEWPNKTIPVAEKGFVVQKSLYDLKIQEYNEDNQEQSINLIKQVYDGKS
jgi:guanylate kinase